MHPPRDLEAKALWAKVTRLEGIVTALQQQVTTLTATVASLQWFGPPRVPPTPPPGLGPSYCADLGPLRPPHRHCPHLHQVPSHTPDMAPMATPQPAPPAAPVAASPRPVVAPMHGVPPTPASPPAPAQLSQHPRPPNAHQPLAAAMVVPPAAILLVRVVAPPAAHTTAALDHLYTEL